MSKERQHRNGDGNNSRAWGVATETFRTELNSLWRPKMIVQTRKVKELMALHFAGLWPSSYSYLALVRSVPGRKRSRWLRSGSEMPLRRGRSHGQGEICSTSFHRPYPPTRAFVESPPDWGGLHDFRAPTSRMRLQELERWSD